MTVIGTDLGLFVYSMVYFTSADTNNSVNRPVLQQNAAFPIEFRRDPLWSRPRVDWIVFGLCFRDFSLKLRLVQLGRSPLHVTAANHVSWRSGTNVNEAAFPI